MIEAATKATRTLQASGSLRVILRDGAVPASSTVPGWQPPQITKQHKAPDCYHAYLTKCLERAHMRVYLRELRTGITQVEKLDRGSKSYADWKAYGGGPSYDGEERVLALREKVLGLAGGTERDAAILTAILASHTHCQTWCR